MCQVRRERHAGRLAGRVALGAAVLMAGYLAWRPLPGGTPGRVYAGVAVVITYLLVRKIAAVIAVQMLPNHTGTTE
jgi:CDP-diacylglycerol pyrophosphatase